MSVERRKIGLAIGSAIAAGAITVSAGAEKFPLKSASLSRAIIGPERTSDLERVIFLAKDLVNRSLPNENRENPFGEDFIEDPVLENKIPEEDPLVIDIETKKPSPFILPEITQLNPNPKPGEGSWTTEGLPNTSPNDILMAKTFIYPDPDRPKSHTSVLLFDKRRIKLHITGGTKGLGGYKGITGPGRVDDHHMPNLLAAWNGGWQGTYDNFGMYADGKEYKPMANGLATIVVMRDGTIKMGEWGRDFSERTDDMVAMRQNVILMIDKGKTSKRINEGNDTWGYVYVNSREDITWRSAVGLTKNGDLLVATGESVSAQTFARGLLAAGAEIAMPLDNNTPQVQTVLAFKQPDNSVRTSLFVPSMYDKNANRYTDPDKPYGFDFMYVTLDESNYR